MEMISKCNWLIRLVFISVLQFEKSLTPDIERKSLTVISKSFIFKLGTQSCLSLPDYGSEKRVWKSNG